MTVHTLTGEEFRQLDTIVRNLGDGEAQLQPGYSGRGMYGDRCLALVGSVSHLVRFALALGQLGGASDEYEVDEVDVNRVGELVDALQGQSTRSDQLGLGMVYYWPGIEVES